MGVAERRAREKEALRRAILDAAGELIVENGYENLSIRKIADKIEYAPATIYLYFKDKMEILASICIDVFSELSAKLHHIAASEQDPIVALRRGLRCYIEFGLAHPSHYLVTFSTKWPEPDGTNVVPMESSWQAGLAAFGSLQAALDRCVSAGAMPPGNTNLRAQIAWTAIHGLTSAIICTEHELQFPWEPRESLIEGVIGNLLAGFATQKY